MKYQIGQAVLFNYYRDNKIIPTCGIIVRIDDDDGEQSQATQRRFEFFDFDKEKIETKYTIKYLLNGSRCEDIRWSEDIQYALGRFASHATYLSFTHNNT